MDQRPHILLSIQRFFTSCFASIKKNENHMRQKPRTWGPGDKYAYLRAPTLNPPKKHRTVVVLYAQPSIIAPKIQTHTKKKKQRICVQASPYRLPPCVSYPSPIESFELVGLLNHIRFVREGIELCCGVVDHYHSWFVILGSRKCSSQARFSFFCDIFLYR